MAANVTDLDLSQRFRILPSISNRRQTLSDYGRGTPLQDKLLCHLAFLATNGQSNPPLAAIAFTLHCVYAHNFLLIVNEACLRPLLPAAEEVRLLGNPKKG